MATGESHTRSGPPSLAPHYFLIGLQGICYTVKAGQKGTFVRQREGDHL